MLSHMARSEGAVRRAAASANSAGVSLRRLAVERTSLAGTSPPPQANGCNAVRRIAFKRMTRLARGCRGLAITSAKNAGLTGVAPAAVS